MKNLLIADAFGYFIIMMTPVCKPLLAIGIVLVKEVYGFLEKQLRLW
jgi:hypothetical protein